MDLKSGYHQLLVHEADRHKTAFILHRGLYKFNRVPFGLSSADSHICRSMHSIFHDYKYVGKFLIEDIVIYSRTFEEHLYHVELVLARLQQYVLCAKPSKCHFAKPQVKLLGYLVNKQGIATDPDKVEAIVKLPPPTNIKQV